MPLGSSHTPTKGCETLGVTDLGLLQFDLQPILCLKLQTVLTWAIDCFELHAACDAFQPTAS